MEYLSAKDRVLFQATPMLMAPRFGVLPQLEPGNRRLISAADGIYIEARSPAIHLCQRIAKAVMPYGVVEPFVRLVYGNIPMALLNQARRHATDNPESEVAACLLLDHAAKAYRCVYPEVISSSHGHISYRDAIDDSDLVIDFHSHAHHPAYFSDQDDQSDLARPGPYIALVAGNCDLPNRQTHAARIVCPPYLLPMVGFD